MEPPGSVFKKKNLSANFHDNFSAVGAVSLKWSALSRQFFGS